jgi:hypothetical protein
MRTKRMGKTATEIACLSGPDEWGFYSRQTDRQTETNAWARKGYWLGIHNLLVAFIFSFTVPKGPRILTHFIDHITAGESHGTSGCSTAYVHAPPMFPLDKRTCPAPCTFTTRVPPLSFIATTMKTFCIHLIYHP